MDVAMAPPSKRRKLAESSSESIENSTVFPDSTPTHAHAVEPFQAHSTLGPPWPTPTGNTEQPIRVAQPAVGGIEDFKVLLPRQGALLSSVDSAVDSVISSANGIVSASESISVSISAGISLSETVRTDESSTATVTSAPSSSTATSSSTSLDVSSSGSSASSSTTSTSIGNTTSTVTNSSSSTTGLTSLPANSTTSTLASGNFSQATSTETISASNASSIYLATLTDGVVSTISRNSTALTTTLPNGEIFTIPGLSTTTSTDARSTNSFAPLTTTIIEITSVSRSSDVEASTITSIATIGGAGAGGAAGLTTTSAPSSTASSAGGNGGGSSTPPAGTIAGGVVGGAAGLAVVMLIAMLFIRWYRRRAQMGRQPLPPGSIESPDGDGAPDTSHGPGMAERAGLMPIMASLPALFRHHNRSIEGSVPSERGFTRVSGRKLPSAFSEGMSSDSMYRPGMSSRPPPPMPLAGSSMDNDAHEASHLRDSAGYYGVFGDAWRSESNSSPSSDAPMRTSGPELMTMSPGPQRQPQIHTGGPYVMSPTGSDGPTSATLDRSESPSTLRNSRFTEDM